MSQEIETLNQQIDKDKSKIDDLLNLIDVKDQEYQQVKTDLNDLRLKDEDELSPILVGDDSFGVRFESPQRSSTASPKKRSKTPDITSIRRGTYWGSFAHKDAKDKRDELGCQIRDFPILALAGQRWVQDLRSRSPTPEKAKAQTSRIARDRSRSAPRYRKKRVQNSEKKLKQVKPDEIYSYSKVYTQKQRSGAKIKKLQSRIRNQIKGNIQKKMSRSGLLR